MYDTLYAYYGVVSLNQIKFWKLNNSFQIILNLKNQVTIKT